MNPKTPIKICRPWFDEKLPTLFIDMDGTTARFYEAPEALQKAQNDPDYYRQLRPYENMLAAVKRLIEGKRVNIVVLTAYINGIPSIVDQKKDWLNKYLPGANYNYGTIFIPTPANKAEAARKLLGRPLQPQDILLDDYTKLLYEWEEAGGTAIKVVNEIQNPVDGASFPGNRLGAEDDPEFIYKRILYVSSAVTPKEQPPLYASVFLTDGTQQLVTAQQFVIQENMLIGTVPGTDPNENPAIDIAKTEQIVIYPQ